MTPPKAQSPRPKAAEGWHGWDDYAAFYDWENRQTMGRRDVRFWQQMAKEHGGPVLELGCGTGRVTLPVARGGVHIVGVDRSTEMLSRAVRRLRRIHDPLPVDLIRSDIRFLPFRKRSAFKLVIAPYGILQSLIDDDDLTATLESVAAVTKRGTVFGIDLVSDVPAWAEYKRRVRIRGNGPGGSRITLVESVRQDAAERLTIFDQEYIEQRPATSARRSTSARGVPSKAEGRGGVEKRVSKFSLAFRTLPLAEMVDRVEKAGFKVETVLGDYDGRPWDIRSDVWLILARRA